MQIIAATPSPLTLNSVAPKPCGKEPPVLAVWWNGWFGGFSLLRSFVSQTISSMLNNGQVAISESPDRE